MDLYCALCNKVCLDNDHLSNGKVYHNNCYEDLIKKNIEYNKQLLYYKNRIYSIEKEERKIFSRIKVYFFGLSYRSTQRQNERNKLLTLTENLEKEFIIIRNRLKSLYDYWLERPPDWEERRKYYLGQKPFCEECFSDINDNVILQVHHIIPISQGGSHKSDNFKVLCRTCHQLRHVGNNFNSISHIASNPFKQKLQILNEAIKNGEKVSFNYRKREGEKSSRVVKPNGFELVGKTLCIYGFCFLRQDKRIFAIKHISKLKRSH